MTIVLREEWRALPIVEADKLYSEGGHGCSHTADNIAHLHARFSSRSLNLAQE